MASPILNVDIDDTVVDFTGYAKKVWLPRNWGSAYEGLPDPYVYNLVDCGWFQDAQEMERFLTEFALSGGYRELEPLHEDTPKIINELQRSGVQIIISTVRGSFDHNEERKAAEIQDTIHSIGSLGIRPDGWMFTKDKTVNSPMFGVDDSLGHHMKYHNAGVTSFLMDRTHNREGSDETLGMRVDSFRPVQQKIAEFLTL